MMRLMRQLYLLLAVYLGAMAPAWALPFLTWQDGTTRASPPMAWRDDQAMAFPHQGQLLELDALPGWRTERAEIAPGNGNRYTWLAFAVHYPGEQVANLVLSLQYAQIRELDVALIQAGRVVAVWHTGNARAFSSRPIPSPRFAFPLLIAPASEMEVLIRTRGYDGPLAQVVRVEQSAIWHATSQQESLYTLLSMGFTLAMMLFCAGLFLAQRDALTLCALIYLGSLICLLLSARGYAYQMLGVDDPLVLGRLLRTAFICGISAVLFMLMSAMGLQRTQLRAYFGLLVLLLLSVVVDLTLVWDRPLESGLLGGGGLVALVWAGCVVLMLWARLARLIRLDPGHFIIWLPYAVLSVYLTARYLNWLPYAPRVFEWLIIGHAVLLSLGLARRVLQMRAQVLSAEAEVRAQGDFLARMSHEIRTPMNAVLGMSQLLRDTSLDQRQTSYVGTIFNASNALLGILDDILDFAKLEAGKLQIERIPFDLEATAVESLGIFKLRAQEQGVELICTYDRQVADWCEGDPTRVRQILVNFVGNAVKFTRQGEIELHVSPAQHLASGVRMAVRDTGTGLSAEDQSQLFKRFSQARLDIARKHGGTGLGLAICKQLVDLMGGEIGVSSREGEGSIFWCELPLARVDEVPATGRRRQSPKALIGKRLLVVEDNTTFRDYLGSLSQSWGMQVVLADGAEAAKCALQAGGPPFDLISLDWNMPGENGVSLAQRITREGLAPGARMILLTGMAVLPGENLLRGSGIARVEEKPVHPGHLKEVFIDTLLGQAAGADGRPVSVPPAGPSLNVLLVDDNATNRMVAGSMLTRLGHRHVLVEDGQQALEAFAANPERFDVVLMDCEMPVMDGWQAAREIRALEREWGVQHIPIIALTAHALQSERDRCIAAGMNEVLHKPILLDALSGALRRQVVRGP